MRSRFFLTIAILVAAVSQSFGHDLRRGDSFIDPSDHVENSQYVVAFEYSDGTSIKTAPWIDREDFLNEAEFGTFWLSNKVSGVRVSYEFILDGGKIPRFRGIETEDYCDIEVLLVFVQRDTPRYGGSLSRWLTTYVFRADTFEFLAEYDGTPYEITRFDSRVVPEVDSTMRERYLVSCFPVGRGRPFDFGLIDRRKLYGPDWCGPHSERCEIKAPTASGGG